MYIKLPLSNTGEKGPVHKRRLQSKGFVLYGHFADKGEGILHMRTSKIFVAKKLAKKQKKLLKKAVSNIWCSYGQGILRQ